MITFVKNVCAMNANRQLNTTYQQNAKSIEKLSSGFRINRAADDAAGLSISEKMRKQIRGLTMGVHNTQDGVSLCQVADAALAEVNDMLNRITELAIKAANGTMSQSDRKAVQDEVSMLSTEISRIGYTTTFNDIHIFDYANGVKKKENVDISLIRSPSAAVGYLSEVYAEGGRYYPSASMDFSALTNASQISRLNGRSFSFTCSQSCPEAFEFTFVRGNGSQSRFLNPETLDQSVPHKYQIDIRGIETGAQLLDTLFKFVKEHPARSNKQQSVNGVLVSHSNVLVKTDDTSLVLRATTGYNTREQALQKCKSFVGGLYGKADFSGVSNAQDQRVTNILSIHYGADSKDNVNLYIERMNEKTLGLNGIRVTSVDDCFDAIDRAKEAMETINRQRSNIGAHQNRLEHTIINEDNVIENLTASESRIRDTDMAKELVRQSLLNILEQAGQSVLTQANQNQQGALRLFN